MRNYKEDKKILFLTILINLTGFTIILPLSPALLGFYLPNQEASGGILGAFVHFSKSIAENIGEGDSLFMTSVFFGCSIASLYALLQFIFSPLWGALSDRFGRKPILIITLTGTCVSYFLWIIADSFLLFLTSRILAGIMAGNISIATAAIADITSKQERTRGMALVGIAFALGFLVGPAIGGICTQYNLLETYPSLAQIGINPFSLSAIIAFSLGLINCLWTSLRFKETLQLKHEDRPKKTSLITSFRSQSREIFNTNLTNFIFILAFSGLEFTLSFLATERFNYTPVHVGYLFLYIGFILILTQGVIVRRFSSKMGEKNLASMGILSGMLSFAVIAFSTSLTSFYIGSGLLALAIGMTSPSLSALVSLYASESTQGQNLGLYRSAGALARAFGPLLAAIPYFCFGSKAAYLSASFILVFPLIIIFFLPNPKK